MLFETTNTTTLNSAATGSRRFGGKRDSDVDFKNDATKERTHGKQNERMDE